MPWDRKQNFESLRHLTIEETYEPKRPSSRGTSEVGKEVGDLMLHMVFYSRLGSEAGAFDAMSFMEFVTSWSPDTRTSTGMWRRRPRGGQGQLGEDQTQGKGGGATSVLGRPLRTAFPVAAQRIQKVRGVGFDWDHAGQVWDKVQRSWGNCGRGGPESRIADEFGDVLFALINYARFLDVNPDELLERTNRRFKARFEAMERRIAEAGLDLGEMPLKRWTATGTQPNRTANDARAIPIGWLWSPVWI